ncbi:MAG TPA: hypothetical protein VKB93_02460 [Thermoanaerobaculia bacterium]|nr:hypothetical protein [Thermoanaerobaculia bacterium]
MFATLAAATACSSATAVCTLIGCESGVTVHLSALPSGPFHVEVKPSGASDVRYVFDCTGASDCRQDIFFPGLITEDVIVTVTVGSASKQTQVSNLAYESQRPNGADCPPDCRTVTVVAQIPT